MQQLFVQWMSDLHFIVQQWGHFATHEFYHGLSPFTAVDDTILFHGQDHIVVYVSFLLSTMYHQHHSTFIRLLSVHPDLHLFTLVVLLKAYNDGVHAKMYRSIEGLLSKTLRPYAVEMEFLILQCFDFNIFYDWNTICDTIRQSSSTTG